MKKIAVIFCSTLLALACLSLLVPSLSAQDPQPTFKLVIHADNPTEEMESSRIAKIFLKKTSRWEDGERVVPVDQITDSPVRAAFSETIHRKSVSAIKSYWQRMIFSGREVPPEELPDDDAVLQFVTSNHGGVGYVASSTPLGEGVKELRISSN